MSFPAYWRVSGLPPARDFWSDVELPENMPDIATRSHELLLFYLLLFYLLLF